jgi:hypothetical protein
MLINTPHPLLGTPSVCTLAPFPHSFPHLSLGGCGVSGSITRGLSCCVVGRSAVRGRAWSIAICGVLCCRVRPVAWSGRGVSCCNVMVGSLAFGASGWCGGAWIGGGGLTQWQSTAANLQCAGCWRVTWLGGMAGGGVGGDEACMVGVGGCRACAASWHIVGAAAGHAG